MAATFDIIATYTYPSDTNLVTFSSIPSTYDDLFIVVGSVRVSANTYSIAMYYNNDTGSNYGRSGYYASGAGGGSSSGQTGYQTQTASGISNWIDQAGFMANTSGQANIYIAQYANTSINKTALIRSGAGDGYTEFHETTWLSTAAINRIDFAEQSSALTKAGTVITIYGIKAA